MSPKNARPKHTHGGARPGSGRPARDTIPVTVRLHPATLALLGTANRSREIEYAILAFFRYHLQSLLASPSTKGTAVPGSPTSTPRPSTKKSAPSEPTPEAQQYARRLHTRLRAAEKAFAADAPELK